MQIFFGYPMQNKSAVVGKAFLKNGAFVPCGYGGSYRSGGLAH